MNKTVTIRTKFIQDEQKILPSELKAVEFKIGEVTFYSGWKKNFPFTIWTYFIPNEQKILPPALKDVEFKIGTKFLPSERMENIILYRHKSTKITWNFFIPDKQKFVNPDFSPDGP